MAREDCSLAQVFELEGVRPVIDPSAFVHPTAVLIGDAIVGPECYVGPGASLRGDFGRVVLKRGSNLQDNCIMHSFPGTACVIEEDGHIGHGAVLHGCTVARNALVGMNAVIMDGAIIGEDAMVGAMAFVKAGFELAPGMLCAGTPAKVLRPLTDQEKAWKAEGTGDYRQLTRRCLATLKPCEPLQFEEAQGRPALDAGASIPLFQKKAEAKNR